MSDDYPNSTTREFCGNFILCVAVAILIIVEILLPDIAQLEDPVFAGSRCKLNYQRPVLRTGPAPETMIPVSDPAIGQINLIVKDYPVLGCRQSFLPPMADHMGIGQDCLSGAGQIEADITQADWSWRAAVGPPYVELWWNGFCTGMIDISNQQAGAVGLDRQPVMPFARVIAADYDFKFTRFISSQHIALQKTRRA